MHVLETFVGMGEPYARSRENDERPVMIGKNGKIRRLGDRRGTNSPKVVSGAQVRARWLDRDLVGMPEAVLPE